MSRANPRRANGARRDALRRRVAAAGGPCWLCGQPIDYSLTTWVDPKDGRKKRHPWSFELDEVVPVSLGGDPLDPANVRPAHRTCNQRRGNRMPAAPAAREEGRRGEGPGGGGGGCPWSRDWLA